VDGEGGEQQSFTFEGKSRSLETTSNQKKGRKSNKTMLKNRNIYEGFGVNAYTAYTEEGKVSLHNLKLSNCPVFIYEEAVPLI